MKVPQISGTMPNFGGLASGFSSVPKRNSERSPSRGKNSIALDTQHDDDADRGQDGDDRAEDQADGDGRFPESEEPRMARPQVIPGRLDRKIRLVNVGEDGRQRL